MQELEERHAGRSQIRLADQGNDVLAAARAEIDWLDRIVAVLLTRRLKLAQQIGGVKSQNGCQVKDLTREKRVMAGVLALCPDSKKRRALRSIYRQILRESARIQFSSSVWHEV